MNDSLFIFKSSINCPIPSQFCSSGRLHLIIISSTFLNSRNKNFPNSIPTWMSLYHRRDITKLYIIKRVFQLRNVEIAFGDSQIILRLSVIWYNFPVQASYGLLFVWVTLGSVSLRCCYSQFWRFDYLLLRLLFMNHDLILLFKPNTFDFFFN